MDAISCMQAVVHCERVSHLDLCTLEQAEPLRVSPPEAVAYLLELLIAPPIAAWPLIDSGALTVSWCSHDGLPTP